MAQRRAEPIERLRDGVRLLGGLVGDVLREQGGPDLFAAVEHLRTAAIALRSPESDDPPAAAGTACILHDDPPAASAASAPLAAPPERGQPAPEHDQGPASTTTADALLEWPH